MSDSSKPPLLPSALLTELLKRKLFPVDLRRERGGDIHTAVSFFDGEGKHYFLKYGSASESGDAFLAEGRGLWHLAKAIEKNQAEGDFCLVPRPLACQGRGQYAFLLLPYIERGLPDKAFWEHFGRALAGLHRIAAEAYGFPFDNFIGSLLQSNRRHRLWSDFYAEERLLPQGSSALDAGLFGKADMKLLETLVSRLSDLLPEEGPQLIHGDLWSGNFLCDQQGRSWLIDPAPYYGHREMDLAMSRLFGGFDEAFYSAYREAFPLIPAYGERQGLYQLYYLLVHLNLFGRAYYRKVRELLEFYT